ncbi:hypothetical protein RBG61_03655 [Paludicola sp. MB14-C6]|uniref:hypothetical protein n=1 Tax=Paludihabitans sp. MB14-C6 TaxID=3070656 RepID=UPI0027DE3F1A|nr:hypothetical protein [Paludicola sp. MB14-C6]WMJ23771.1 hypothetical protein RBG61_03655 [Paludicola sp. MB14-C6]
MNPNNAYTSPNPNQNYQSQQPPIYTIRKTKSKFLTFIFSLIPGAGQMYQGLMKKGISIMGAFFGIIAFSVFLYIPVINFALPIIWFFAFFDAINRINYTVDELKAIQDSYIVNLGIKSTGKFAEIMKKRHLIIGWVLIAIAIYALINILLVNNYDMINYMFGRDAYFFMHMVTGFIPKLIVPIVCLLIGIKLIKGTTKKQLDDLNTSNIGGTDIEEQEH